MSTKYSSPTGPAAARLHQPPALGSARVRVLVAVMHGSCGVPRSPSGPEGMSRARIGIPELLAARIISAAGTHR